MVDIPAHPKWYDEMSLTGDTHGDTKPFLFSELVGGPRLLTISTFRNGVVNILHENGSRLFGSRTLSGNGEG